LVALTANTRLEYDGIDICHHPYVVPAVEWLQARFPERVHFHPGRSLVLPRLARQGASFDVFDIDGAKGDLLPRHPCRQPDGRAPVVPC
jgi:hypothetical protein